MTFVEKYHNEDRWYNKVLIMAMYHNVAIMRYPEWTLQKTATVFDVSIGLVSENIKLAEYLDKGSSIINCRTRTEALDKVRSEENDISPNRRGRY